MTSLAILLAADALAKLGATVGGGLAVIGAGIGIGKSVVRQWMLWHASQRCSQSCSLQ